MRSLIAAALAATMLTACSSADTQTAAVATYSAGQYGNAINDIARTQADRDADLTRKPGDLLAFAQIDKGESVGDYMMGGGYVTRLLAMAVGANGKVYAFQPTEFIAFRPAYATEQDESVAPYAGADGKQDHVIPLRAPVAAPGFPAGQLDRIITVMNLHDLYNMPAGTPDKALAALFASLKPGGKLVVIDHKAADEAGLETTEKLHRIDEKTAIAAVEKAGFKLEEESDLYARPDDPHTASVFDDSIRGKTDQFALRFVKPI